MDWLSNKAKAVLATALPVLGGMPQGHQPCAPPGEYFLAANPPRHTTETHRRDIHNMTAVF